MKTAEEKAKKYADDVAFLVPYDGTMNFYDEKRLKTAKIDYLAGYKEATEIAFKEGQSNPKIKQLEWQKFGKGEDLISKVLLGDYIISDNCSTYKLFINRVREGHSFFNLNDAKQFAQSHFEARIKECLITE